jgi:hypothetical protein
MFVFGEDGDVVGEDFSVCFVEEEDLFEFEDCFGFFVEGFQKFGGVVEDEEVFEFGDDSAFFVENDVVGVDLVECFCGCVFFVEDLMGEKFGERNLKINLRHIYLINY